MRSEQPTVEIASARNGGEEDEDELIVTGTRGVIANEHLPHARENCAAVPFGDSKDSHRRYCCMCFCYVCDVLAAECNHWESHCSATHRDELWKLQRQVKLQAKPTAEHSVRGPGAPFRHRSKSKRIQVEDDESSDDDMPLTARTVSGQNKRRRPRPPPPTPSPRPPHVSVIEIDSSSEDDTEPLSHRVPHSTPGAAGAPPARRRLKRRG